MNMTAVAHHLPDEFLLDDAAGAASAPIALVTATHLSLCPACRRHHGRLEAIGGAMLERIEPVALAPGALDHALARLDQKAPRAAPVTGPANLPEPLWRYVQGDLAALKWRERVRGVAEARLDCAGGGFKASLLRIAAGRAIARHTHNGDKITLVLEGAFSDAKGRYARGDVCFADPTIEHEPVADRGSDCLCLIITQGPIKLTGKVLRVLNPFLKG
jgi:putative transcriptional regulator